MPKPIKNRIVRLDFVRAGDIKPDPRNWREHDLVQLGALTSAMNKVGIIAPVIVREVDGEYMLIDGHLRTSIDPNMKMPVVVVDLDHDEAAAAIASFDPIGELATTNRNKLGTLVYDGMEQLSFGAELDSYLAEIQLTDEWEGDEIERENVRKKKAGQELGDPRVKFTLLVHPDVATEVKKTLETIAATYPEQVEAL